MKLRYLFLLIVFILSIPSAAFSTSVGYQGCHEDTLALGGAVDCCSQEGDPDCERVRSRPPSWCDGFTVKYGEVYVVRVGVDQYHAYLFCIVDFIIPSWTGEGCVAEEEGLLFRGPDLAGVLATLPPNSTDRDVCEAAIVQRVPPQ